MKNRKEVYNYNLMSEEELRLKPLPPHVYTSSAHLFDVQIFLTN